MIKSIMLAFLRLLLLGIALAILAPKLLWAQLVVEVTGAGGRMIPVALPALVGEELLGNALTPLIRQNLEKSGLFRIIETEQRFPDDLVPDYAALMARGADAVLTGSVVALASGEWEARVRLFDVVRRVEMGGRAFRFGQQAIRMSAHRIADFLYETLTGTPGFFASRLAFVVKSGSRYELKISDWDGSHAQTALISNEPIISPAWSPDGRRLAYVSFERKKPVIYIHELASGVRRVAADFRGSNSAPAWSPDGRRLAVTLTQDGVSQIYVLELGLERAFRISRSGSIDTEPVFAPDGQAIYFTSDRGGSAQIYRMSATGGEVQRITFEGGYNASPDVSRDGRLLAYITRVENRFRVAVQDLTTGERRIVSDGERDESPSFAPNGRMIVYATEVNGRGMLAAVSYDGRIKLRLSAQGADVREPAWGPLLP